jgi:hypothetical protein
MAKDKMDAQLVQAQIDNLNAQTAILMEQVEQLKISNKARVKVKQVAR